MHPPPPPAIDTHSCARPVQSGPKQCNAKIKEKSASVTCHRRCSREAKTTKVMRFHCTSALWTTFWWVHVSSGTSPPLPRWTCQSTRGCSERRRETPAPPPPARPCARTTAKALKRRDTTPVALTRGVFWVRHGKRPAATQGIIEAQVRGRPRLRRCSKVTHGGAKRGRTVVGIPETSSPALFWKFFEYFLEFLKISKKQSIAFGSAPRRQSANQSVSHASSQSGKQAGRQKHTVWVFSVADLASSGGEHGHRQIKQRYNGNAPDRTHVRRLFESRSADRR